LLDISFIIIYNSTMSKYLERLIDTAISEALQEAGCVVVEGPKWCGKSTSARRLAKTVVELQWPSTYKQYKMYADTGDAALLRGETPIMFDEWQTIPDLWNYARAEVDRRGGRGHFILTGSAKPVEDKNRHSGIGRMKKVVMRPMSMWESGDSDGTVSIKELFDGNASITGKPKHNLSDIAYIVCRGGWPEAVTAGNRELSLKLAVNYVHLLVTSDIVSVDDIKRNPTRAKAILRTYARNISQSARLGTLLADMDAKDAVSDIRTFESYINALKKLYVIEDVEAWSPRLRSKASIRTTDTRHFVDPSIAAVVLEASPSDLENDLETFGLLFESLCIRDLRVYSERLGGTIFNYRDSLGLEVDAVIHLNNGKWGAIEVKLGGEEAVNKAAKNLIKLRDKIDESEKSPSFFLVITATGFAHRRPDGVLVVPIGCLKD
jgi:predicted AAA+ superfamily ATPase